MTAAAAAEPEALRRALEERGLQTTVEPTSWREYPQALVEAFVDWIADRFGGLSLPFAPFSLEAVAWIVVALLVTAIALLLFRAVASRARRRVPASRAMADDGAPRVADAREAPRWAREAEERLARGDVRGALEAAWWWLATGLAAEVEASLTTREVVLRAGRRDLVPLAQRLDRLTFGSEPPARHDVAALLRSVGGALA